MRHSMEDFVIHGEGPAARYTKMLAAAGCDISSEKEMGFGMMAYNTALLVWSSHELKESRNSTLEHSGIKVGRNDPCPCRSGLKYKKCCLSSSSDVVKNSNRGPNPPISFDAKIIPRLWDDESTHSDMAVLGDLFDTDPNLQKLKFSTAKVETFLKNHRYDFDKKDEGTVRQFVDKLATQYAEESGECKLLEQATDLFMKAAKNARTSAQLRALATGVVFSTAYKARRDIDNPLTAFIFRRSMGNALQPVTIMKRIAKRFENKIKTLGENGLFQSDAAMEIWSSLNKEEQEAFKKVAENTQDELWDVVSAGKFPVGLPFATTLPLWYRANTLEHLDKAPEKDKAFMKLIRDSGDTLTDDDYRLFEMSLEDWLSENKDQEGEVADSVRMMHMLAKGRGISFLVPTLLIETCRSNKWIFLDDEEAQLVESWKDLSGFSDYLRKHADYFYLRGYPQIAARTRSLVTLH